MNGECNQLDKSIEEALSRIDAHVKNKRPYIEAAQDEERLDLNRAENKWADELQRLVDNLRTKYSKFRDQIAKKYPS